MAEEARRVDALHESGYRFVWPPTIGNLTQRQERLLMLAERAEAYLKQEQQNDQQHDRPDNFGSVGKSRRDAFH